MQNTPHTSIIGEWWSEIDKPLLGTYAILLTAGIILIGTASPPVAERIGIPNYIFLKKHLLFLAPALIATIGLSMLTPKYLRLFALALLTGSIIAIALTLLIGDEIKGAKRWLSIFGQSIQPSEFVKPAFAVICAWLLSTQRNKTNLSKSALNKATGYKAAITLTLAIAFLLLMQPDWGQTLLVLVTAFSLFLMVGIPLIWCGGFISGAAILLAIGYSFVPHVRSRFDGYFGEQGSYQVQKSLQAFGSGGFTGRGPAEGSVKRNLPDSHTDFIFAVAAEEFGFVICAMLIGVFIFLFIHVIRQVTKQNNHFILLACTALIVQLSAQSFINIASSLNLTPTTGMTLPLISYGGSSLLAVSITFGLLLGFTRKRTSPHN